MYPGDDGGVTKADTTEIYGALGWKWFTAKYSYYVSDEVFGFANADGSDYLGLSASLPIGETGLTLGASWGTFSFENNGGQDYEDWSVSAAYDLGKAVKVAEGVTVGLKYTDTDADKAAWSETITADPQFLGDATTTVWLSKAF